ncbi:hypothetical protein OKW24_003695 [Peribacillus simplex]|nr:hypothetical protein [Peribacillus simplex]SNT21431.1 hypothetical protein SAMN05444672_10999 [Bacillus sp. OK838]
MCHAVSGEATSFAYSHTFIAVIPFITIIYKYIKINYFYYLSLNVNILLYLILKG